jgi:hypothetical protein
MLQVNRNLGQVEQVEAPSAATQPSHFFATAHATAICRHHGCFALTTLLARISHDHATKLHRFRQDAD